MDPTVCVLDARKQMQIKAMNLEQILRGFWLKVGDVSQGKPAAESSIHREGESPDATGAR